MKESVQLKDVFTINDETRPGQASAAEPEGKSRWTRVGIGFTNRDDSINVILDAIPVNGRLHIRNRRPFPKGAGREQPARQGDPV